MWLVRREGFHRVTDEFERLQRDYGWSIEEHASLSNGVWLTSAAGERVDFPDDALPLLAGLEDQSLWFQARNDLILDSLRRFAPGVTAVWDVGAGNGSASRHLQRVGIGAVAVEPSEAGASAAALRGVSSVVCGTLQSLHLPSTSLPSIGMFDVIEHLAEPSLLLDEAARVLQPGGVVLVTVPASMRLWSQADEVSGHHTRYDVRSLDAVMASSGFTPLHRAPRFFSATLPLYLARTRPYNRGVRQPNDAVIQALEGELGPRSGLVDRVGRGVLAVERVVARIARLPFGTSVLGVYRRASAPAASG